MEFIDILLFIEFSSFPINRMLYLLFVCSVLHSNTKNLKKKKELALKYITIYLS